jgi:hypothetical protein
MIPMTQTVNPKVQEFLSLLQDPAVKDVLDLMFMQFLTSPEINLVSKVGLLMDFNGLDVKKDCVGWDWEWDDMDDVERIMYKDKKKNVLQPLPDQLSLLSERINDASLPVLKETVLVAGNETEVRARLLKEKLSSIPYKNGKKCMLGTDVQKFLLHEIEEEHRPPEKGVRQAALDVMKKAVEQFPDEVRLKKTERKRNVIEYIEKPFY